LLMRERLDARVSDRDGVRVMDLHDQSLYRCDEGGELEGG
jgi:hypothetical protein